MKLFYKFIVFDEILFFFKEVEPCMDDVDDDTSVYVFTNEPAFAKGFISMVEANSDVDISSYEGQMVRLDRLGGQPTLIKTLNVGDLLERSPFRDISLIVSHTINSIGGI
ncbi:MAG: hypothetical protein ACRC0G_07145 [Fusobacteriaceae bacterium]